MKEPKKSKKQLKEEKRIQDLKREANKNVVALRWGHDLNKHERESIINEFDSMRESKNLDLDKSLLNHSDLDFTEESYLENAYKDIKLNLRNINIRIKQGQCVALIGKVGAGKSSFLSCLAGELYSQSGSHINLCGSMAYVSQKAWITSKSIKENILFHNPYDEKRYKDCIRYSCMEDDMKIMQQGDDTQLGDKGVNLSGGQKIRLSIARAMYSNQDIYLFDDPISALDIHVGKYVMEEGIVNYLKGKTRIVATHALPYLKFFD